MREHKQQTCVRILVLCLKLSWQQQQLHLRGAGLVEAENCGKCDLLEW